MKVCLYFSRLFSRFVEVLAFNGSSTRFSPCDVFVNERVSTNKEKQYNVGYYVSIADIPVPLRIGPCGGVVRVSARNNEPVGSHQCACPEFRPSLKKTRRVWVSDSCNPISSIYNAGGHFTNEIFLRTE